MCIKERNKKKKKFYFFFNKENASHTHHHKHHHHHHFLPPFLIVVIVILTNLSSIHPCRKDKSAAITIPALTCRQVGGYDYVYGGLGGWVG